MVQKDHVQKDHAKAIVVSTAQTAWLIEQINLLFT